MSAVKLDWINSKCHPPSFECWAAAAVTLVMVGFVGGGRGGGEFCVGLRWSDSVAGRLLHNQHT